jgi:hypothetical protein
MVFLGPSKKMSKWYFTIYSKRSNWLYIHTHTCIHTHTRIYTQLGKAVDECMFRKGGAYLYQISDSVSSNVHFACGENKTKMIYQVKLHF